MTSRPDLAELSLSGWSFAELVERLDLIGFFLVSESTAPPLLPGEPELAQFVWRQGDAELTTTFDPVQGHRRFELHGPEAEAARACLLRGLPLDVQPAVALLQAVREAIPRARVWDALDIETRRQVLRWMIKDGLRTDRVKETASTALLDEDWEVRTTAMVLVARAGIESLGLVVRRCPPPPGRLTQAEKSIVRGIQKATLEILGGADPGQGPWAELRAAVEGLPGGGIFADYLRCFTEPLLHGFEDLLERRGVEFYPIPSTPHRMGALDLVGGAPLRTHTPGAFLLAQGPLTRAQVGLRSRPGEPWIGTRAEARTICLELGRNTRTRWRKRTSLH